MSLSTRCPACSTTFKVVPDQLKISEGWVRCGQCGEVFDATAHLRPLGEDAPAPAPAPASASTSASPTAPTAPNAPTVPPGPVEDEVDDVDETGAGEPDAPPIAPPLARIPSEPAAVWLRRSPAARVVLNGETFERPAPVPHRPDDDAVDDDRRAAHADGTADDEDAEGDFPSALLLQTADNDEPQQSLYQPAFEPPAAAGGTLESRADVGDAAATLRELDFVRVAERRAFWQQPLVVLASALVCALLAAALGLQFLHAERDRLAAYLPGLKPLLVSLCVPLRCEVLPLQRIDAVVIDASSFNKARGELFQFDVELRNTATVPLAMPALELTLTDSQDQPLVRRVLLPAELRAPRELASSGAWSGSLPVALQTPVSADRVAGYRVLAFYP
ncbi:DUF3426 domain-containing protein [Xylophilus sp. Kf1]|nr:DUF3426 domain-containing protein [Xylophilus sp. Kf1]